MQTSPQSKNSPSKSTSSSFYYWAWQSDENPWKEKDPSKWSWTNYSSKQSSLIEEAYLQNKKIVDLGDYEVILADKIQVKKQDRNRIRRICRFSTDESSHRLLIDLATPKAIDPKTFNDPFGDLDHFLVYILKKSQESKNLFDTLVELKMSSKQNKFQSVVDAVVEAIMKGGIMKQNDVSGRVGKIDLESSTEEAKKIVKDITSQERNLREFLKLMLNIYTRETFVCYWLNELLRMEKWEGINLIAPFLVCLCFAFKMGEELQTEGLLKMFKTMLTTDSSPSSSSITTLYRGACFFEEELKLYDPNARKYFSWNSITSTSRSPKIGEKFMWRSQSKANSFHLKKIPVLFEISIDKKFSDSMIDVSQISQSPDEQEVILAPATVYKLLNVRKENSYYKIYLEVKRDFIERDTEAQILAHLDEKIVPQLDKALFENLSSEKFKQTLELLAGNEMVETMKIDGCVLSEENIQRLNEVIVKLKGLRGLHVGKNLYASKVEFRNMVSLFSKIKGIRDFYFDLSSSSADYEKNDHILGFGISDKQLIDLTANLRNMISLFSFRIAFDRSSKLTEASFKEFFASFRMIKALTSIDLSFYWCQAFDDATLVHLVKGIDNLNMITKLHLNFSGCLHITTTGLILLSNSILTLTTLEDLSLELEKCSKINDECILELFKAFKELKSMRFLNLNYSSCSLVSNKAILSVAKSIQHLSLLEKLSLNFTNCPSITHEGVIELLKAINSSSALKNVSIFFEWRSIFTKEILKEIELLNLRKEFEIDFGWKANINAYMIKDLTTNVNNFTFLTKMSLNFSEFPSLKDKDLKNFLNATKGISNLTSIYLDLSEVLSITEDTLTELALSIASLTGLVEISLLFEKCYTIFDVGITLITSSVKDRWDLEKLFLSFKSCENIKTNGFLKMVENLEGLSSITNLTLLLDECPGVDDSIVENFIKRISVYDTMRELFVNFKKTNMSEKGVKRLIDWKDKQNYKVHFVFSQSK